MPATPQPIFLSLDAAAKHLLPSTSANIRSFLQKTTRSLYVSAVQELLKAAEWAELNDRFFRTLAFGTGGLRGRTMGKVVTKAERGRARDGEPPEFPCVGTNAMNFYNVSRATQGLVAYLLEWRQRQKIDRKSTRVNSSHLGISYAVFCLKKK